MNAIYYIGDSTVQFNKIDTYPQTGMSQVLSLFTAEGVTVHPHGKNGRSTKSFLDEGRFEPVRQSLSEGDFLLIQFGHNDEKIQDPSRYTQPFGEYQENLRYFIGEARKKGAYPVLITPLPGVCLTKRALSVPAVMEIIRRPCVNWVGRSKFRWQI